MASIYSCLVNKESNDKRRYCQKCIFKREINNTKSQISIFDRVTDIIFNSTTMPDVYHKMEKLNIPFKKWLELNEDGYSVFHWFSWYISVKIKKYHYIKSRVFAFFQKVFSDNTVTSIFNDKQIKTIIKLADFNYPTHTILYHLVRYCEDTNDTFYLRLQRMLIEHGIEPLTECEINEINNINNSEKQLPNELKMQVSEITNNYKFTEELIIKNIEEKYHDCTIVRCVGCGTLIDYIKEIPKIITYAKENSLTNLLDLIWNAYYQRKSLNKIFNEYYKVANYKSNLNMIHKRHSHVLEVYEKNLVVSN